MSLSIAERNMLKDVYCILRREHDPDRTALALAAFAAEIVRDRPEGRTVVAWAMRRHVLELDADVFACRYWQ